MMVRRSFGTIHHGHLPPDVPSLDDYWNELEGKLQGNGYTAGAFALEEGSATKRKHIQFYVEHSRKRTSTLANEFGVTTEAVFDRVRDAQGSWNYCTGTGTHEDKPALDRFVFGTPKLHGDTQRADLKLMVSLIIDGMSPQQILKEYPYAYTVHRRRLWDLYRDLNDVNLTETMFGFREDI
tara:strand:- start:80 stop:622 length:543 start_codon:yes stop_codon:yes gene_type:complete